MKYCLKTCFLILFISTLVVGEVYAQKRRHKPIKISRSKARVVCPVFETSQYPFHGIGFKLGDPFAFTYKFYPNKHIGFAIDAGSAASGLYSEFHRENFDQVIEADTLLGDQGISYISHKVNSEWVLEAKLLFQRDASDLLKGLQWYVGAGWQWRQLDIDYEYLLEVNFADNEIGIVNETQLTMGPTGVIGIEYSYFDIPLAAFLEIESYFDISQNPGWIRLQGGVGLRYVF